MIRHLVHHFAIRFSEPNIVLKEIAMSVHVSHDQFLVHHGIAFHQIGIARVRVDNHFVNFRKAVFVGLRKVLVLHTEFPVRIPDGKTAVGRKLADLIVGDQFKNSFKAIKARLFGITINLNSLCF
ncbi:hypothetical protein D3C72_1820340 [compost metagenome]